jgi:hypothetical protein
MNHVLVNGIVMISMLLKKKSSFIIILMMIKLSTQMIQLILNIILSWLIIVIPTMMEILPWTKFVLVLSLSKMNGELKTVKVEEIYIVMSVVVPV